MKYYIDFSFNGYCSNNIINNGIVQYDITKKTKQRFPEIDIICYFLVF